MPTKKNAKGSEKVNRMETDTDRSPGATGAQAERKKAGKKGNDTDKSCGGRMGGDTGTATSRNMGSNGGR